MSKRWIAVLVVGMLFVGLAITVWEWYRLRVENHLTVENRSGQTIAVLKIKTGGQESVIQNLADGARSESTFRIASDDHFAVDGRLADGTVVTGNFGYVTNGMSGERATFVVIPKGKIQFEQSNNIGPY